MLRSGKGSKTQKDLKELVDCKMGDYIIDIGFRVKGLGYSGDVHFQGFRAWGLGLRVSRVEFWI